MDNHFFHSAIHGFRRQDVIDYIETVSRQAEETEQEHCRLQAELESRIQTLQQEKAELVRERDCLTEKLQGATEQMAGKEKALRETETAQVSLQGICSQQEQQIEELSRQNQRLLEQVEQLQSEVAGFQQDRSRITQMELEAHQRAGVILSEADAQAKQLLEEAHQRSEQMKAALYDTIGDFMKRFGEFTQSFHGVSGHVNNELRKLDVAVTQLPISLDGLEESLRQLQKQTEEL